MNFKQRNLRGFTIAKCYFNVGEYNRALHYVSTYLSIKSDSPQAYRMQGQCYEKLGKLELALQSYQTSLQLAINQPDLITDVCKLFLATDLSLSQSKARHWCNQAKALNIQNETVLNLNLLLASRDSNTIGGEQVEQLIKTEIIARPNDIALYIRLVKFYTDNGRIDEAFTYVCDVETKDRDIFVLSLDWQNSVAQMLTKYKMFAKDYVQNWKYWLLLITSLERQLFLNLCTDSPATHSAQSIIIDCTDLLLEFDHQLNLASKYVPNVWSMPEFAAQFMTHFRGQFCLHAATLLFKKELVRSAHWRETTRTALPLLLLAYNCGRAKAPDQSNTDTLNLIDVWRRNGAFRCSQAGRTILGCIDDTTKAAANSVIANIRKICLDKNGWHTAEQLLTHIRQMCSDTDWRKSIFKALFNTVNVQKLKASFFMQCTQNAEPIYELPEVCDLEYDEEISQWLNPSALSHIIYLSMNVVNDVDKRNVVFNGLTFSISTLNNCGAETLNQLDVDSFMHAATIQAMRKFEVERNAYDFDNKDYASATRPKWLPYANVATKLCGSDEQAQWWRMAYKLFKNTIAANESSDVRTVVQYGIETVRGVGGPKMDPIIAFRLATHFCKLAKMEPKTERTFLEARAESLYKYGLQQIKRDGGCHRIDTYRKYYFKYAVSNANENEQELNALAEEAITFLAGRYFQAENYEECIDELSNVTLPVATYFQAQAYRLMNESNKTPKKNKRAYIEKAKECLNLTLALLEHPSFQKSSALKLVVHSDMAQLQQQQQQLVAKADTSSFLNGSNSVVEDFLNDSLTSVRHRRDGSGAAATPMAAVQPNVVELENLVRKMMETLTLVRDEIVDVKNEVGDIKTDMISIRTKLNSIEEQVNKKQDTNSVDPSGVLDDYFIIEDELNNQGYMSGSSMYPNYSQQQRIHTPNQMIPPMMGGGGGGGSTASHHQQAAAANAAAMSAMQPYNNQFYNGVYQMGLNPYHAAIMSQPRVGYQYPEQALAYQQTTSSLPDPRNSVLGLLTQPPAITPVPLPLQQQSIPQIPLQGAPILQAPPPPQLSITTPSTISATVPTNQSNLLRTWNSSYNTPVDKSLPANVVITNSDPLPVQTAVTAQPTLSVTIPSHHIKNNPPIAQTLEPFAAQANLFALNHQQSDSLTAGSAVAPNADRKDTPSKDTQPKSIFNSFSSTPITTPNQKATAKDDVTTTVAPKPTTPFANFSFSTNTQSDKPLNSIFSNLNKFSAANVSPATSATIPVTTIAANTSRDDVDDYVPTAQFEPVIELPDLVEVTTGEENETIKFEHRAKLMRYDKEIKEWKERGIGNIKVLVNKDDPKKVRLLMRRDQVLKLCCNQMLAKDTQFTAMPKLDTALTWYGQDYSDNELQIELFAIRFKAAAVCKQFHDSILDAQKGMMTAKDETIAAVDAPKPTKSIGEKKKDAKVTTCAVPSTGGFGDKFKPIVGSWTCDCCYVSNKADSSVCLSCNTTKPSSGKTESTTVIDKPKSTGSASNNGFGDLFKPKTGSWSCKQCYISNDAAVVYCVACESPKDDSVAKKEPKGLQLSTSTKFSFGMPAAAAAASTESQQPTFSFGNASQAGTTNTTAVSSSSSIGSGFSFGQPQAASTTVSSATLVTSSGFSFGTFTAMTTTNAASGLAFGQSATTTKIATTENSATTFIDTSIPTASESATILAPKESFSFVFKPKASIVSKAKSPVKSNISGTEDVSDDENIEEENNTYFTPVIPLPDKVKML